MRLSRLSFHLLTPELKHLIVELCSGSPNSLAALARTHSAYRREAEMALYDTISIYALINDSLKCLQTLVKNTEKAAFVRSLNVEYAYDNINRNQRVTNYLLKSLINMESLSDFRVINIRLYFGEAETQMMEGLGKILCQGHFQLQTLYCNDFLDISKIIKSQPDLQILGLYTSPITNTKTFEELRNAQFFLPIVFTLERETSIVINHIGIFPSLYSADRRATIHQVLAQSFRKDQGMVTKAENITELSIYLIDSSDMPSICAIEKNMAVTFPRIDWVKLWFKRRCEIPPQEAWGKEESSIFSNLRGVGIYVWPNFSEDG